MVDHVRGQVFGTQCDGWLGVLDKHLLRRQDLLGRQDSIGQVGIDLCYVFGRIEQVVGLTTGHLVEESAWPLKGLSCLMKRIESLSRRAERILGTETASGRIIVVLSVDPTVECSQGCE